MKKILFASALAALASTAAIAHPADGARGGDLTRADVQARVAAGFERIDADGDGFVTRAEAQAHAEARREGREARRGQREDRREVRGEGREDRPAAAFARLDANRDGVISRSEFENRQAMRGDRRERRALRQGPHGGMGGADLFARLGGRFFDAADRDRDGRVSRTEADASALAVFERVDANRDGTVSHEERRSARESFRAQRPLRNRG